MWIVMGLWGGLQLQSVDVVVLLIVTRCWCAEVMALRVLSSQVPLLTSSQAGTLSRS